VFSDALRQVVRCGINSDDRPVLTGVLMAAEESGCVGGHDSYRLASVTLKTRRCYRGTKVWCPVKRWPKFSVLAGRVTSPFS